MIYLNKYEKLGYWLYTDSDNVYSCEETGDGMIWYDGNGWTVESESLCEKLTNARAEALARMPKRVEIRGDLCIYTDGVKEWASITVDCDKLYDKFNANKINTKLKITIEEVASSQEARQE